MTPKKILVVDDDALVLKSLEKLLERQHSVKAATGGQEGLDAIKEARGEFDIILCDLSMPEVNGANLYLDVMKNFPGLEAHIIFMTGGPFSGYIKEFAINNNNACLQKPFGNDELNKMIEDTFAKLPVK